MKVARLSGLRTGLFTPGNIPGNHLFRGWVNPRAIVWPEGLCQWKIPVTSLGIEPTTFWFVPQCLNQLPHRVLLTPYVFVKCYFACFRKKDYYRKSSECEVKDTCAVAGKWLKNHSQLAALLHNLTHIFGVVDILTTNNYSGILLCWLNVTTPQKSYWCIASDCKGQTTGRPTLWDAYALQCQLCQ
jgi:hypothetical protein